MTSAVGTILEYPHRLNLFEKVLKKEEFENLLQRIPEPKRLVFFPEAEHEDLLHHDPRRFIRTVNGFLKDFSPSWEAGRKIDPVS